MPIIQRKRRAVAPPGNASEEEEVEQNVIEPRRQERRPSSPNSESDGDQESDAGTPAEDGSIDQLAKKLVRFALANEVSRLPVRRTDISQKVLGQNSRSFKKVFEAAQQELRAVFGMEMVELPLREKVTIQQRRAAQKQEKQATSSNSWILTSILPDEYRVPEIIPPASIPTSRVEGQYVGLYTFVVSLIYLSGGQLPEAKLERYLRRVNADHSTPLDKTDKLLQRMIRDGYILKIKDVSGGDEVVDYMVGPRGKVEISEEGAAGLVRAVHGESAGDDLERRIERSLNIEEKKRQQQIQNANEQPRRTRGRPRRNVDNDSDIGE